MSLLGNLKWVSHSYATGLTTETGRGLLQDRAVYVICSNWVSAKQRFHVTVKVDRWPFCYCSDMPCSSVSEGLKLAEVEVARLLALPPIPRNRIW